MFHGSFLPSLLFNYHHQYHQSLVIPVITFMMRFVCAILQWISAAGTRPVLLRQLNRREECFYCICFSSFFTCLLAHHISDLNPRRQLVRSLQAALLATAIVVKPCRVRVAHTGLVLFSVCDTKLDIKLRLVLWLVIPLLNGWQMQRKVYLCRQDIVT